MLAYTVRYRVGLAMIVGCAWAISKLTSNRPDQRLLQGALTAVSLFRRHDVGSSLSSGQGKQVEGVTRKRSDVVAGCRGCRRFDRVERTIKLRGVVAAFRPNPIGGLATG